MSLFAFRAALLTRPCSDAMQALLALLPKWPRPRFHDVIDEHADQGIHGCVLYLPL